MLDSRGFDLWADGYDRSVDISDEDNTYPFAGYKKVLAGIYDAIRKGKGKRVLDIGFGTGILAGKLYENGYDITGIDFSERMIQIAKEKMPSARLIQHDFSKGLPAELADSQFDVIICTYAIHHLVKSFSFSPAAFWVHLVSSRYSLFISTVPEKSSYTTIM